VYEIKYSSLIFVLFFNIPLGAILEMKRVCSNEKHDKKLFSKNLMWANEKT
jgi:hypothetical protein